MRFRSDSREDYPFLLTTSPPRRGQRNLAIAVLAVLVGALLITAPFAGVPFPNSQNLVPAYAAAIFLNELITAALLLTIFAVQRAPALLILSAGYLFSGATILPWMLTFPGVLASLGVPDAGLQSTAAIAVLRRLVFPLTVLAYALMKDSVPSGWLLQASARRIVTASVVAVVALAAGSAWLVIAHAEALPKLMRDTRHISALWHYVPMTAIGLYLAGLAALGFRRRSVLDLWLMVVLCALLIETLLLSYLSSGLRLSAGWWAGRFYGLVSASLVLLVLLAETMTLYARLARSIAAERRVREARLTAMEAFSASIAHEVNQPLASMVTNADAGLRWLGREAPDVAEAQSALRRIVDDGHRAGKVIEGIRTMFNKGARERVSVDVNRIILEVLARCRGEARLGRLTLRTDLAENLPPVAGSPVQLQQVVANLVANAVESLGAVADRERLLCVRSALQDSGAILVSVEDSGVGLDPDHKDRIFEPFFTTRADGMGMGLMFCRSVIEAHGGRLWALAKVPQGAIFQFTLPRADDSAGTTWKTVP